MTREDKIKKLIDDDFVNYDDYDGVEINLKRILRHGFSGYNNYSDIEIDEEFADRIGFEEEVTDEIIKKTLIDAIEEVKTND